MCWLVRPLSIAIVLAAGIAASPALDRAAIPGSARWVAALVLAVVAARRGRAGNARALAIIAAVLAAGAARGHVAPPIEIGGVDDRVIDRVTGAIAGPVVRTARGTGARLDTTDGPVWVWADDELRPGERIAAIGYLATPAGGRGVALPDRDAALRARGARVELTARTIERLADEPDLAARAWRLAGTLQRAAADRIERAGGDPVGSEALAGIAIGERRDIPPELDARWRATGIYHVLSVSGLHLAIVALMTFAVLRRLIAASPWGGRVRPACWAAPPTFVIAVAYTLVTGAQLATVRALVVVAITLAGRMLDRPARLIDALGVAAIAILAWRPADLLDPGFELSFVAALTLAVLPTVELPKLAPSRLAQSRAWLARVPSLPSAVHWLTARIRRGLVTSAWVTLATAPITAYHFQQVAAGGVVGNVAFTLALELVALPLALAGVVIDWDLPVWLAACVVGLVDRGAEQLAIVTPVGHVAVASATVACVLVALAVGLASRARRTRVEVIGWLALCVVWAFARMPPPDGALRVTFVDVGQGDAAIVELPDGAVWLVDAGGRAGARDLAAAAAPGRDIARMLAAYGHDHIDIAIVSHPHPDHYLGLAALAVPIRELWFAPELEPHAPADAAAFAAVAATLVARGTRVVLPPLGRVREQAGVELVTWAPRYQPAAGAATVLAADPVRTVNDNSLVVAVRYRGRSLLFSGDVEAEGEAALVATGLRHVDVVKVAHHGSRTSSTQPFVDATRPALAVISCARGNAFGFPADSVVERWRAAGAEVARTDHDGTITVTIDAGGALAIERAVQ